MRVALLVWGRWRRIDMESEEEPLAAQALPVVACHAVTNVERFTEKDTLTGGEVLPGFGVPAAELLASE
jgi:hypothetical protein